MDIRLSSVVGRIDRGQWVLSNCARPRQGFGGGEARLERKSMNVDGITLNGASLTCNRVYSVNSYFTRAELVECCRRRLIGDSADSNVSRRFCVEQTNIVRKASKWTASACRMPVSNRNYSKVIWKAGSCVELRVSLVCSSASSSRRHFGVVAGALSQINMPKAGQTVDIVVNPDSFNNELLSRIPVLKESYNRPFYLRNGHVETIFAHFFRSVPNVVFKRECLRMEDGGTVSLDWPVRGDDADIWEWPIESDAPVLILLPGLSGGSQDTYVRNLLIQARKVGWRGVVFNSRGCADSPVTSAQFYSASYTEDLRQVVKHVRSLYRKPRIYAAGWSLGANILVRYLGQEGESCLLAGGISLCNPFNLVLADDNFHKGFNRVYDRSLARQLGKIFSRHISLFVDIGGDFNVPLASNSKSIRDFDNAITRVSFGFATVDEYYYESSSDRSIKDVKVPLLCIQAEDDPIAPSSAIPRADIQANTNCALLVTPAGGHLGWVAGPGAPFGVSWTDPVMMDYLVLLEAYLKTRPAIEESEGKGGILPPFGFESREREGRPALASPSV